jgi:hypothetical protein
MDTPMDTGRFADFGQFNWWNFATSPVELLPHWQLTEPEDKLVEMQHAAEDESLWQEAGMFIEISMGDQSWVPDSVECVIDLRFHRFVQNEGGDHFFPPDDLSPHELASILERVMIATP